MLILSRPSLNVTTTFRHFHHFVPLLLLSSATSLVVPSLHAQRPIVPPVPKRTAGWTRRSATTALLSSQSQQAADGATATMASKSGGPELPPLPATAKRLFLVRHGEVINPGGDRVVFYGGSDVPLSPLGELEAQAAADYLQQFQLSRVFSSPLSRAVYGAEQVKLRQPSLADQEITVLEGFTELNRGDWCGLTKDEIGADLLARFDACDESVTPGGGGESYPDLKRRVLEALHQALSLMNPGTAGCLVSHLQVTRSILSEALNVPTSDMVKIKVATASVTCIDYDGSSPTVHFQSFKPDVGLQASKDGAN